MRKISFLFIFLFAILSNQCKEKCIGEPIVIVAFEQLKVQILNPENEGIFINNYDIGNLEIYENENKIEYSAENVMFSEANTLSFPVSITEGQLLSSNFGEELITNFYFKYNDLETDTLEIKILPVLDDNNCNEFYETIEIIYNSNLLEKQTRRSCISCSEPIVLIKN